MVRTGAPIDRTPPDSYIPPDSLPIGILPGGRSREATYNGVEPYMYNKIRILLSVIQRKHGFPMREHHTVAFFDLIMFSIPFHTKIRVHATMTSWDRDSIAGKIPVTLRKDMRYRQVLIANLPNELQSDLIGLIPFGFDTTARELFELALETTTRTWPIFENLVTFGGMNDVLIQHNWDKIRLVLNKNGY